MRDTLLLAVAIIGFLSYILFALFKPQQISKSKLLAILSINGLIIIFLLIRTDAEKIKADISRIVKNSGPHSENEILTVLFHSNADSCTKILNLKDQELPFIDCCVWIEMNICNQGLKEILGSKTYETSIFHSRYKQAVLNTFDNRPDWWNLSLEGDSIIYKTIKLPNGNIQSLLFAKDSAHVFVCDRAL